MTFIMLDIVGYCCMLYVYFYVWTSDEIAALMKGIFITTWVLRQQLRPFLQMIFGSAEPGWLPTPRLDWGFEAADACQLDPWVP